MRLSNLHEAEVKLPSVKTNKKIQAYDTAQKAGKGDWTNKSSVYADPKAANKPDEKLLTTFRGKGLV